MLRQVAIHKNHRNAAYLWKGERGKGGERGGGRAVRERLGVVTIVAEDKLTACSEAPQYLHRF